MTITVWYCEDCGINNFILDNNCTKCGKPYLDTMITKEEQKNISQEELATPIDDSQPSGNFDTSSESSLLRINTMTNNAVSCLEFLINSNTRARELLKSGIEFCSMIEKGDSIKDFSSDSELEILEFMQVLNIVFKPEELSIITRQAKEIKKRLNYALTEAVYIDSLFSLKEIYEMQKFFNYVGKPFSQIELSKMQRK
jgi:hypothetical protein